MLYLSSILLIECVSFQEKAKVKLENCFREIIKIVGNRAGKDLKCHLQTFSPITCEKQDSGHFQTFFKSKT